MTAWAAKIKEVMGEKPTLFVIDAANLGGEAGLLQLLRQAGLDVEGENNMKKASSKDIVRLARLFTLRSPL